MFKVEEHLIIILQAPPTQLHIPVLHIPESFKIMTRSHLGVKHPGTGEPSIGVRDILMFSMLINLLILLLLPLRQAPSVAPRTHTDARDSCTPPSYSMPHTRNRRRYKRTRRFFVPSQRERPSQNPPPRGGGGGGGFVQTEYQ